MIATELLKLLLKAGFPLNGINMVLGRVEIGQQIVKDDRVNVISFVGLRRVRIFVNWLISKKVPLELGGNASMIIHEDIDLERAAHLCTKTGFSNSGQSCISVQRIYVHKSVISLFIELLKQEVSQLKIGDPLLPDTSELIFSGKRKGARWIRRVC